MEIDLETLAAAYAKIGFVQNKDEPDLFERGNEKMFHSTLDGKPYTNFVLGDRPYGTVGLPTYSARRLLAALQRITRPTLSLFRKLG